MLVLRYRKKGWHDETKGCTWPIIASICSYDPKLSKLKRLNPKARIASLAKSYSCVGQKENIMYFNCIQHQLSGMYESTTQLEHFKYHIISFISDVEWLDILTLLTLTPWLATVFLHPEKRQQNPAWLCMASRTSTITFTGSMGRGWTFHCWSGLCDVDFCLRCSMWFFLLNIVFAFVLGRLNHMLKQPFSGL